MTAIRTGVLWGITILGFFFYRLLKKKNSEKKRVQGEKKPPTSRDTLEYSLFDVVGILRLREGYTGVTKESFFFFG
jgi:hypothetical protein